MWGFKLLFKNNFKNTIKNKIQFVGLVVLVFLTCLLFTFIEVSKQRVENVYQNFISEKISNQHDFVIDFDQTNYVKNKDVINDQFNTISDLEVRQHAILDFIQKQTSSTNLDFVYNRVEGRTFSLGQNKIIKAVTLNPQQTVDRFVVTTGMPVAFYEQYLASLNKETRHWVYLTPEFARKNQIEINDIIRLQEDTFGTTIKVIDSELEEVNLSQYAGKDINQWLSQSQYSGLNWFRVVGFGQSADYITPIIDSSHPFPNMKNEGIAYLDQSLFGLINATVLDQNGNSYNVTKLDLTQQVLISESQAEREFYYVAKFKRTMNDKLKREYISKTLNPYLSSKAGAEIGLGSFYLKTIRNLSPVITFRSDNNYQFANRTNYFTAALDGFIMTSYILIIAIMIISLFVLILVLRRQIEATGPQNGILRALGYRRRNIVFSYLSYPLMICFIGGVSGYLIGISGQIFIKYIFGSYFNLPYTGFAFAPTALVTSIIAIFVVLTCVTLLTATFMILKKTPLQLIKKEESESINHFKRILKKIFTIRNTFDSRFQAVQLSNSVGKMIGVSLTMVISTIMITVSTAIPLILQNNIRYSYEGDNFNTIVEYNSPVYNLPTTFLKTYDPTATPWNINDSLFQETNMTKDVNKYISDFVAGTINPENYSPTYDAVDMRSLLYKNISKEFLQSNKLTVNNNTNYLSKAVCTSTWQDYRDYRLDNMNKKTIEDYLATPATATKNIDELEKYRLFYWKYRETIALDIQRSNYFVDSNLNLSDSLQSTIFTSSDYKTTFGTDVSTIVLDNYHLRAANEVPLAKSFYDVNMNNASEFASSLKRPMYNLYNWIYAYFINNVNQCFTQGIYTRAPQTVRTQMINAFNQNGKGFNLSFGVVPFNPKTDDRASMFSTTSGGFNFNVFGINPTFKNQTLTSRSDKTDLKFKLQNSDNSIVINETLAKALNLNTGNQINLTTIKRILNSSQNLKTPDSQEILDAWNAIDVTGLNSSGKSVGKLLYANDNNYSNAKLGAGGDNKVLISALNPIDPNATNPTILNKKIAIGEYVLNNEQSDKIFQIVGVTNQYGKPKAWVNNQIAEKVLGYDQSRNALLRIFMNEWAKSFVDNSYGLTTENQQALTALQDFIRDNVGTPINKLWEAFLTRFANQQIAIDWIKVFQNEYPIFNYKLSKSSQVDDIETGLATNQVFGDYSFYGLNGGDSQGINYPPYSESSFNSLVPLTQAKAVLQNIANAVKIILLFIIIISFVLSFMIIILTSNIVIAENLTIIATMKVLGYRNRYITKLVIGMYIPIIVIMTIVGFGFGWLALTIGQNILVNNGIALPLIMSYWLPIVTIGSGLLLYLIAYLISWYNMNRIKPLVVIMSSN